MIRFARNNVRRGYLDPTSEQSKGRGASLGARVFPFPLEPFQIKIRPEIKYFTRPLFSEAQEMESAAHDLKGLAGSYKH